LGPQDDPARNGYMVGIDDTEHIRYMCLHSAHAEGVPFPLMEKTFKIITERPVECHGIEESR
jgi:hypothetical protein